MGNASNTDLNLLNLYVVSRKLFFEFFSNSEAFAFRYLELFLEKKL